MRIIPDDVKLTEGGYCDGLHYDASDTIEITDTEWQTIYDGYEDWKEEQPLAIRINDINVSNDNINFGEYLRELIELKRAGN